MADRYRAQRPSNLGCFHYHVHHPRWTDHLEGNVIPTGASIIFFVVLAVILSAALAAAILVFQEVRAERSDQHPGWDTAPTSELSLMSQERRKERARCPVRRGGCGGTHCLDWRRNHRPCGKNPTRAEESPDPLSLGRHHYYTVRKAAPGWWPFPRTRIGRRNPQLWHKVAAHAQVSLSRPAGIVLP